MIHKKQTHSGKTGEQITFYRTLISRWLLALGLIAIVIAAISLTNKFSKSEVKRTYESQGQSSGKIINAASASDRVSRVAITSNQGFDITGGSASSTQGVIQAYDPSVGSRVYVTPPRASLITSQQTAVPRKELEVNAEKVCGFTGYQVQLGVFSSVGNAKKLVRELEQQGIPARIMTRVQVGPFKTRAEADAVIKNLRALEYAPLLESSSQK